MQEKFRSFLDGLTLAQREAVEQVYLHNEQVLTQEEVAKKLGISTHSLANRLEGAKKKLREAYPEYRRQDGAKSRKTGCVTKSRFCEPAMPAQIEVIQIDPVTQTRRRLVVEKSAKNRTRYRSGVDKAKVRRWIRERCPIPYPAI